MSTTFKKTKPIFFALLAAVLYGISAPFSKILLGKLSPYLMASLLYLGAGIGMIAVNAIKSAVSKEHIEAKITSKEVKYVVLMILLDIAAPIFYMLGLKTAGAGTASLLNNFEITATSLIALLIFKEAVGKRMWFAILLITLASILLSISDFSSFRFSSGALLIILACVCWGFENNCTRMLSLKDPIQIVVIKGFGSGLGALLVAFLLSSVSFDLLYCLFALLLGFMAYGLSIFFYIKAQRSLGAARTSAYYAAAPFIGVAISFVMFREKMPLSFIAALVIMIIGTYFLISEKHSHLHTHGVVTHEHSHTHDDMHHMHTHDEPVEGEHSHIHTHVSISHQHEHTPDMHHTHKH